MSNLRCKSITARKVFKNFPDVKKELWGGHFWSEGGHIDTIGDGYDPNIDSSSVILSVDGRVYLILTFKLKQVSE